MRRAAFACRIAPASACLVAAALAGCGAPRVGPPAPVEVRHVSHAQGRPSAPTLATQEQRLSDLLRGKPVDVAMQRDGSLRLQAPLRYCFDTGSAELRPACAETLDRLAADARWSGKRVRVTAPTDSAASRSLLLATERASNIRERLEDHGLLDAEISLAAVAQGAVSIVVSDTPQRSARS